MIAPSLFAFFGLLAIATSADVRSCKIKKAQLYARNDEQSEAFQSMIGEFGTATLCEKDDSDFEHCDLDYKDLSSYQEFIDICQNTTNAYLYQMNSSIVLSDCSTEEGVVTTTYQVGFNITNAVDCFPMDVCANEEERALVPNVEFNMKRATFGSMVGLECTAKVVSDSSSAAADQRGTMRYCYTTILSCFGAVIAATMFVM